MIRVFVYGTLRRGEHNNYLLEGSIYRGEFLSSTSCYEMYGEGVPFLRHVEAGNKVRGDLYEVSGETLRQLDLLEGHPHWYHREEHEFTNGETTVMAWVYLIDVPDRHRPLLEPKGEPLALEATRFRRIPWTASKS